MLLIHVMILVLDLIGMRWGSLLQSEMVFIFLLFILKPWTFDTESFGVCGENVVI